MVITVMPGGVVGVFFDCYTMVNKAADRPAAKAQRGGAPQKSFIIGS